MMNNFTQRPYRVIVSLPAHLGELLAWATGWQAKSNIVCDALLLYYSMSERERAARLAAIYHKLRATVQ